ncbi:MAG: hypothetical protein Q8R90_06065, partial [Bacteroidales bacterium]|nr:hypothetical protein [Bacteroidales bacterium]
VAETSSLLNCRTRKGSGGSNPPLTAKEEKAQPVRAKQKKEDRLSLLKGGLFFFALSAARQMGFFHFEAPHMGNASLREAIPQF